MLLYTSVWEVTMSPVKKVYYHSVNDSLLWISMLLYYKILLVCTVQQICNPLVLDFAQKLSKYVKQVIINFGSIIKLICLQSNCINHYLKGGSVSHLIGSLKSRGKYNAAYLLSLFIGTFSVEHKWIHPIGFHSLNWNPAAVRYSGAPCVIIMSAGEVDDMIILHPSWLLRSRDGDLSVCIRAHVCVYTQTDEGDHLHVGKRVPGGPVWRVHIRQDQCI